MIHRFDPRSSFCMGCGAREEECFDGKVSSDCLDNDQKTYLLARHRMETLVEPVLFALAGLGYSREPETRH